VPYRLKLIEDFMKRNGIEPSSLDAVIGRGGLVYGIKTGGYKVSDKLAEALASDKYSSPHASNLGGLLAKAVADEGGIPAFIYDAVTSAELPEVAKITGIKEIHRESQCHVLNSRAMAIRCAKDLGRRYEDMNILVAHLGGGISASAHEHGHIIDSIGDSDGPFSPERAGAVPGLELVQLCYSGRFTESEMKKKVRGKGGMYAHLGTSDCREIEARIAAGDKYAELVFQAQALQIAKCVGELCVVFKGKMDCIVLTGGIAYSEKLMAMVKEYISFLGPVYVYPGELEMEALAEGGVRMLSGEEPYSEYDFPREQL
jgi:butyrate kinase